MNDKKFCKIIYLYITKYRYSILYYRPEKKDVWLINEDNEIIRFIYSEYFRSTEIDGIISNIIRNEARLKKMFKLNSLKIKVLCVSPEYDDIMLDYKKYRISSKLFIERLLYNDKNKKIFIQEKDLKFIDETPDIERYKNRVIELYKRNMVNKSLFNLKYNILTGIYLLLFILHYFLFYISDGKNSFYKYFEYRYQNIISGQFYRMFTSAFVADDIKSLGLIVLITVACSVLLNKSLKLLNSVIVILTISFIVNLLLIAGLSADVNIAVISYFGTLGALFIDQLSSKNDNKKVMYISAISIIYIACMVALFNISLIFGLVAFIIGVFVQIALMKKRNGYIILSSSLTIVILGLVLNITGINTKNAINNYRLGKIEKRLQNTYSDEQILELEKELDSKNRSALTYYELGMIKVTQSSIQDAKKIFIEGKEFDNSFAPFYYNLGLIERQGGNYSSAKVYAQKAYELNKIDKYKNLVDELSKY